MKYEIQLHGDRLEREASSFIRQSFPFYELVWQSYVGNRGNNSMADLPNYPDQLRRKDFAENSYTVLESAFFIQHILKSDILTKGLTNFNDYIDFNKSFITVFALLGRMHDTVLKASDAIKHENNAFRERIHSFYEARSIIIHGKKIPLIHDDLGLPMIPFLKTAKIDGIAWEDKHSHWEDIDKMDTEYAVDKLNDFFNGFLELVNNEYAVFLDIILQELSKNSTEIKFEYFKSTSASSYDVSGSTGANIGPVKVYGAIEK